MALTPLPFLGRMWPGLYITDMKSLLFSRLWLHTNRRLSTTKRAHSNNLPSNFTEKLGEFEWKMAEIKRWWFSTGPSWFEIGQVDSLWAPLSDSPWHFNASESNPDHRCYPHRSLSPNHHQPIRHMTNLPEILFHIFNHNTTGYHLLKRRFLISEADRLKVVVILSFTPETLLVSTLDHRRPKLYTHFHLATLSSS